MKTAVVLTILAVAAANENKIKPAVLESFQQSSTVNVFVNLRLLSEVHKPSSLRKNTKCSAWFIELFSCKDLTKDELFSIAAIPEVDEIDPIPDDFAFDPPDDTFKPVVFDDLPAEDQDKIEAARARIAKTIGMPPIGGVYLCKGLTLQEIASIATLREVNEIRATRDNSVPDIPNITPKPTTTAATPTHSACDQQRDSSDDRD
ncbi:hypothetical protein DYB26_014365 [Aphanomyces astaci]|uniref:Uncharacterized protein n=1 Tax=Aphanomyces astaci TaxID=112090 RepID=A0A397EXA0_APHAT|nr:hypothetical protein DYB26_014365 [Aphanomyces astaci]RHZ03044.1 hypothetical protein DYB31_014008 [Aphanomyces astaci]